MTDEQRVTLLMEGVQILNMARLRETGQLAYPGEASGKGGDPRRDAEAKFIDAARGLLPGNPLWGLSQDLRHLALEGA